MSVRFTMIDTLVIVSVLVVVASWLLFEYFSGEQHPTSPPPLPEEVKVEAPVKVEVPVKKKRSKKKP